MEIKVIVKPKETIAVKRAIQAIIDEIGKEKLGLNDDSLTKVFTPGSKEEITETGKLSYTLNDYGQLEFSMVIDEEIIPALIDITIPEIPIIGTILMLGKSLFSRMERKVTRIFEPFRQRYTEEQQRKAEAAAEAKGSSVDETMNETKSDVIVE